MSGHERATTTGALCGSLPRKSHISSFNIQEKKGKNPGHPTLRPSQSMMIHNKQSSNNTHFISSMNYMIPQQPPVSGSNEPTTQDTPCQRQQRLISSTVKYRQDRNSAAIGYPGSQHAIAYHNQQLHTSVCSTPSPTLTHGSSNGLIKYCHRPHSQQHQKQLAQYSPHHVQQQTWSQTQVCCEEQYDNCDSLNTISYAQAHSIPLSGSTLDNSAGRPVRLCRTDSSAHKVTDNCLLDHCHVEQEPIMASQTSRSTELLIKNDQQKTKTES